MDWDAMGSDFGEQKPYQRSIGMMMGEVRMVQVR